MSSDTDSLVQRFRNYDSTIVSDALDEHDIEGVITGLEPAHPDHVAVGRARPVEFEPAPDDTERTNFPYGLFEEFAANDVFVMDGISPDVSCWGGLASRLANDAGMAGVIIDGGYRDHDDVRAGEFPVFGAARTPRSGQPRLRIAGIDDPITVRDVEVAADDIVVADGTGVVVVPSDRAQAVAETAEELLAKELVLERKVEAGVALESLMEEYEGF